jgi:hypothetical protein
MQMAVNYMGNTFKQDNLCVSPFSARFYVVGLSCCMLVCRAWEKVKASELSKPNNIRASDLGDEYIHGILMIHI